jgi:hypothetical protein
MYQLDHLFICADVGAPEADALVAFGLTEGEPNVHPGQGTANRRFFFHNAMLELLWVRDPGEAQSAAVRPTRLWERWSQRNAGASPFGVCLRPVHARAREAPFPAWPYRPPFLPAPHAIHVAEGAPLSEPMWFYLDLVRKPDAAGSPSRAALTHPAGVHEITRVRLTGPDGQDASAAARAVTRTGVVALAQGPEHLLEIGFDGEQRGRSTDFRPALPLVLRW